MLIPVCATKRLSTSKHGAKDKRADEDLLEPGLKNSAA